MNALKPRPPFQVLVMSEESRLGREQIETAYALKQLSVAGCGASATWRTARCVESPTDKFMLVAGDVRRRARAREGAAADLRCDGPQGERGPRHRRPAVRLRQRRHARREPASDRMSNGGSTRPEAAIVRRIFVLSVAGHG